MASAQLPWGKGIPWSVLVLRPLPSPVLGIYWPLLEVVGTVRLLPSLLAAAAVTDGTYGHP